MTADEAMSAQTRAVVDAFNDAFNRHNVAGVMALMTADCVFENTYPPPDGTRVEGAAAVREVFADFFRQSPQARFEWEEIVALGERCAVRWVYRWDDAGGHVRGIDLFRLRDGKIAEKLSYVKG
ncbi:MAG: nuclear transport factor 2 family protein [Chloroflexi bacterium]|nr:MAG: nuclear transport factor 2 family protein [Chloroflexota bacterium]